MKILNRSYLQNNAVLSLSIGISLLLHACFIFLLSTHRFINYPQDLQQKLQQHTLQFIHTPMTAIEKDPLTPTNLISEKSTQSQNPLIKHNLPKDDPYQTGKIKGKSLYQDTRQSTTYTSKEHKKAKSDETETKQGKNIALADALNSSDIASFQNILNNAEILSSPSKNIQSSAEIASEYRYNAKSHDVARYLSGELKKISHVWQLSLLTESILPFNLEKTVIAFKIMPDGNYEKLQVLNHKGSDITQHYAVNAIVKVSPFSPLPDEVQSHMRDDGLWIVINFNYKDT